MRRAFRVLLVLVVPMAPAAQASPWLCTLPDGRKEFSYDAASASDRACVDTPISRGHVRRAPPPDPYASPAEFPRVDAKTQKKRDLARREILERELAEERRALATAIRELAELKEARVGATVPAVVKQYEERIRTHRTNNANIERELARAG
jgi:hypothetical protein